MKSKNDPPILYNKKNSVLLLTLILLISPIANLKALTQGKSIVDTYNMTRIYFLDISTRYGNTTNHIFGEQIAALTSQDTNTILGHISWNITWDEGITWNYFNITQTYSSNRTYTIDGVSLFTSWWIDPTVSLGDSVYIGGDAPATNQLLRSTPFRVTDLVSYAISGKFYICWLLCYNTISGQQEFFYYERTTGTLVAAQSVSSNQDATYHQIQIKLKTTSPSLPQADPFSNLWFSYGSLAISLALATIFAISAYLLLKRTRQHSVNHRFGLESSKRLKK